MGGRAEFSGATRRLLAERAGFQCSLPRCGARTIGPGSNSDKVVRTGMAAHIYAAVTGGPRGTGGLSDFERRSATNGIWCCYTHGKTIDDDCDGVYSVAQLRAWKRLHEARMGAEVNGGIAFDGFGLVDTIAIRSAPASLSGRQFDFGMCNLIYGNTGSGKTTLSRLISSVADADHVADLSRHADVDFAVRWFNPLTHEVATSGRGGEVRHVLDGTDVPFVSRPYKTICLDTWVTPKPPLTVSALTCLFDLSTSAAKGILRELPRFGGAVRRIDVDKGRVKASVEWNGRIASEGWSAVTVPIVVAEFAAAVARLHAEVEPTFLVMEDIFSRFDREMKIAAYERIQHLIGDAQVAVATCDAHLAAEFRRTWSVLALGDHQPRAHVGGAPIDFEMTTVAAQRRTPRD
jgi:hypothetical protein